MSAPRPGSTIDRAVRALQGGPLPRAELGRLIERDDDELDGLLRYGVRMGLLVRSNGAEDVSYALGTGVPVEVEARPAPGPMLASAAPALALGGAAAPAAPGRAAASAPMTEGVPAPFPAAARPPAAAPANEYTARRESQYVVKAEAARPDATDRDTPAIISPGGGPMGAGQAAAAAPRQEHYRPQPGSQAELLLAYLQRHAPHGGSVWLSAPELGASGARKFGVNASLQTAIREGLVLARGTPQRYQTGPNAPAVLGVAPTLPAAPAAPAAPAPRPAAPAPAPAPAPSPAPAEEHAAALLRHLDAEIDRMRRALGELARRREQVEMVVTMKGRRV